MLDWRRCTIVLCPGQDAEQGDVQIFKQMMPWHRASYYMLIEVLGRPRIPVETPGGYAVLTVVVLLVFFFVPQQLAALLEAIRRDSTYRRSYYAPSKTANHVVVAGHINFSSLHDFLVDFFHEDHHTHRTHVVVLCDEEPPVEVLVLLSHPQLSQWVVYLQGSLERAADLHRARQAQHHPAQHHASEATALCQAKAATPRMQAATLCIPRLDIALGVFLFADKELPTAAEQQRQVAAYGSQPLTRMVAASGPWVAVSDTHGLQPLARRATASGTCRQDLRTISSVLALKSHNPTLRLFVQLLLKENRAFLSSMPDWVDHDFDRTAARGAEREGERPGEQSLRTDQVICVNEIVASMLAISAISPGISTVLTNLYASHHIPAKVSTPWLREYCRGFSNEVYMVSLSPGFVGWSFSDAVVFLYTKVRFHTC